MWEQEPLQTLASQGQLSAFRHQGFWQPMDTFEIVRCSSSSGPLIELLEAVVTINRHLEWSAGLLTGHTGSRAAG